MGRVGIGVIGVGRLGSVHIENLMRLTSKSKIIAICDPIKDRVSRFAELSGAIPYLNYKKMLENKDIDAVLVISPTYMHSQMVQDCAIAGKHIFCEKPIAETLENAINVVKCVIKTKVKFQVGYMRRFDPAYAGAKRLVDEGRIGKPLIFKATSRDPFPPPAWACNPKTGGGLYLDLHTHDFDLARWFMKDEVAQVFVQDGAFLGHRHDIPDYVDNTIISVKFVNGKIGVVDGSWNSRAGYDIRTEILGSEGTIIIGQLSYLPINLCTIDGVSQVFTFQTDNQSSHFMKRFKEAYFLEIESFINCILEDRTPLITEKDGLVALEIAQAAQRSSKLKSIVKLPLVAKRDVG